MEEIRDLKSERIAIYPPGLIPLSKVMFGSHNARLIETFSFKAFNPGESEIDFQGGDVVVGESEVLVRLLKIDDRRLIVGVEGSAEEADTIAASVAEVLFEDEEEVPEPIIVTAATSCTAALDFDWTELYSPTFMAFIDEHVVPGMSHDSRSPWIAASIAQFQFKYTTEPDLEARAVTLAPSNFALGPEPKRPLSDRRFFSSSPTRSENHLRLLEALEQSMRAKVGC